MLLGREFSQRDNHAALKVAVVNQAFARFYFRGRSPIGKWISLEGPGRDPIQIVGVVKNVKYRDLRQEVPLTVYFAALQAAAGPDWHSFVVRAARLAELSGAIQAALQRIDRALRVADSRTLEEHVARTILLERMLATLAGFFGALALPVARPAEKTLFGLRPADPATFALAGGTLAAAALAAAWLPGRSAARQNPVETLRYD